MTGAVCASMFAIGQMLLGGVAWLVQPWRLLIMVLHIPCFILIVYCWILPEGVRWLLATQKYDEARKVLEKVAKVNKTEISEKSMQSLMVPPPSVTDKVNFLRIYVNIRFFLEGMYIIILQLPKFIVRQRHRSDPHDLQVASTAPACAHDSSVVDHHNLRVLRTVHQLHGSRWQHVRKLHLGHCHRDPCQLLRVADPG